MSKYRKKPVVIEAHRWWKNGDHPNDNGAETEGDLVRYFRHPTQTGECEVCKLHLNDHGWIDTLEGGHRVCPGDWVIEGVAGEFYPCKEDIFVQTYEPVSGV